MEGEGTYNYAKTKDVYSGSWVAGFKHGSGCYEYGENKSRLNGIWDNGNFVSGEWILGAAAVYKGSFKDGKPVGPGSFTFPSGVVQSGDYVSKQINEEEKDENAPLADPQWNGKSVFATVS